MPWRAALSGTVLAGTVLVLGAGTLLGRFLMADPAEARTAGPGFTQNTALGQNRSPMEQPADLEWSLTRKDKRLLLQYRITSRAKTRFYLSDLLPVSGAKGWAVAEKSVIVSNGDQPDTVRFSRARVRSETPLPFLVDPGARAIDPGQTLQGSAEVPLPVTAWHYQGSTAAIKGTPHWATLEIGYIPETAHWEELPLAGGGKLTVSQPSDPMAVFRFERQAIPK